MRHRVIPTIALLFLFVIPLRAQEKPNPYERMLESKQQVTEYLIREAPRRRLSLSWNRKRSTSDNGGLTSAVARANFSFSFFSGSLAGAYSPNQPGGATRL